jgi:hypothetical protein
LAHSQYPLAIYLFDVMAALGVIASHHAAALALLVLRIRNLMRALGSWVRSSEAALL